MSDDIVTRLRNDECYGTHCEPDDSLGCTPCEAADEIERLQTEVEILKRPFICRVKTLLAKCGVTVQVKHTTSMCGLRLITGLRRHKKTTAVRIVRNKSVPNVDTERLLDSLTQIHDMVHTSHGLRAWDDTRRGLYNYGHKCLLIRAELSRRGVASGIDCQWCGP